MGIILSKNVITFIKDYALKALGIKSVDRDNLVQINNLSYEYMLNSYDKVGYPKLYDYDNKNRDMLATMVNDELNNIEISLIDYDNLNERL